MDGLKREGFLREIFIKDKGAEIFSPNEIGLNIGCANVKLIIQQSSASFTIT